MKLRLSKTHRISTHQQAELRKKSKGIIRELRNQLDLWPKYFTLDFGETLVYGEPLDKYVLYEDQLHPFYWHRHYFDEYADDSDYYYSMEVEVDSDNE